MKSPAQMNNKVSIIGCGRVGMSTAFSILHHNTVNELVLVSRCVDEIVGEELDLEHGLSFLSHAKITATEEYFDIKDSDIVIITAGAAQQPGETRLDLARKNIEIIETMIPRIVQHAPEAVILIVSNPVDVLTYKAYQIAGLPKGQIFGSGTTLDTARFRFHLSEFLHVNPQSIHTYVLGEHGDSSFPVLSSATVGGQPLSTLPGFSQERAEKAYEITRNAAYKIIQSKGSTYYGIAAVVSHMVDVILKDSRSVLPVSIPLHHYHGHNGVALSVPCVVGRRGVEEVLEIKLSWEEKRALEKSVVELKRYL